MELENNIEVTEDLGYLLGVISGDGTIYMKKNKEYTLSISDKSQVFQTNIIKPLLERVFKVCAKVTKEKEKNSWYTRTRSKKLVLGLIKKFGLSAGKSKTYTDRVSLQLFQCSKDVIVNYIGGWIDAEGSSKIKMFKAKYRLYKYPCITIELVNKEILKDLYELSEKANIPSTKPILLKRNYRKNQKIRYGISWNGFEKCEQLLQFMKNPEKRELLQNKIILAS